MAKTIWIGPKREPQDDKQIHLVQMEDGCRLREERAPRFRPAENAVKADKLEVRHDGSWYEAQLVRKDERVLVHYNGYPHDDEEWTLERMKSFDPLDNFVRVLSPQLQDGQCEEVELNMPVCGFYQRRRKNEVAEGWFDAVVCEIRKRPHNTDADGNTVCTCTFSVKWQSGISKDKHGSLQCKHICLLSKKDVATHPTIRKILHHGEGDEPCTDKMEESPGPGGPSAKRSQGDRQDGLAGTDEPEVVPKFKRLKSKTSTSFPVMAEEGSVEVFEFPRPPLRSTGFPVNSNLEAGSAEEQEKKNKLISLSSVSNLRAKSLIAYSAQKKDGFPMDSTLVAGSAEEEEKENKSISFPTDSTLRGKSLIADSAERKDETSRPTSVSTSADCADKLPKYELMASATDRHDSLADTDALEEARKSKWSSLSPDTNLRSKSLMADSFERKDETSRPTSLSAITECENELLQSELMASDEGPLQEHCISGKKVVTLSKPALRDAFPRVDILHEGSGQTPERTTCGGGSVQNFDYVVCRSDQTPGHTKREDSDAHYSGSAKVDRKVAIDTKQKPPEVETVRLYVDVRLEASRLAREALLVSAGKTWAGSKVKGILATSEYSSISGEKSREASKAQACVHQDEPVSGPKIKASVPVLGEPWAGLEVKESYEETTNDSGKELLSSNKQLSADRSGVTNDRGQDVLNSNHKPVTVSKPSLGPGLGTPGPNILSDEVMASKSPPEIICLSDGDEEVEVPGRTSPSISSRPFRPNLGVSGFPKTTEGTPSTSDRNPGSPGRWDENQRHESMPASCEGEQNSDDDYPVTNRIAHACMQSVVPKSDCLLLVDNLELDVKPNHVLQQLANLLDRYKVHSVHIPPTYRGMNHVMAYVFFCNKGTADAVATWLTGNSCPIVVSARGRPWIFRNADENESDDVLIGSPSMSAFMVDQQAGSGDTGGLRVLTPAQRLKYSFAKLRQETFEKQLIQLRMLFERHRQEELQLMANPHRPIYK